MRNPAITNVLLTGNSRVATVNKEPYMPFENIEAYKSNTDQTHIKFDGDDLVFTGYSIEFFDASSDETKLSDCRKVIDFSFRITRYAGSYY